MWLIENPWPLMIVFVIAGFVLLAKWNGNRKFPFLALALSSFGLATVVFGLSQTIVTERERVRAMVVQMCQDFREKKPETVEYFSEGDPALRGRVKTIMNTVTIGDDLTVTDVVVELSHGDTQANVQFRANATVSVPGLGSGGRQPAKFELLFRKEGGAWKAFSAKRLNPINGQVMGDLATPVG